MKHIAIFIIVLLAAASTASAYTANFSNGFKIQDDALNNVFMVNKQGDVNFTGRMYGNGSGLTDLPASAVADAWVNASGDAMTGSLNVNNKINLSSSGDLNVSGQTLLGIYGSKVGIGTANPAYLLQVANGTNGAAVNLSGVLYVNSTTGNVGIGTANPGQKLDVIGSAYVQDIIYLGRQGVEKHLIFRNVYSTLAADSTAWSIDVRGDVGGANNDLKISRYDNSTGTYVDIPLQISQATGNVGIGTATPTTKLHLIGDLNVSANATIAGGLLIGASDYTKTGSYLLNVSGNASINNTFFVNYNGNVGIGTMGTGNGRLELKQSSDVDEGGITIINSGATRAMRLWVGSDDTARVESADSGLGVLVLNSGGGNVGIGTASPDTILHVIGNVTVNGSIAINNSLLVGAGNSFKQGSYLLNVSGNMSVNNTFFVNTNGNVGIGTATPGQKLDVSGNIRSSGYIYADEGTGAWSVKGLSKQIANGSNVASATVDFTMYEGEAGILTIWSSENSQQLGRLSTYQVGWIYWGPIITQMATGTLGGTGGTHTVTSPTSLPSSSGTIRVAITKDASSDAISTYFVMYTRLN